MSTKPVESTTRERPLSPFMLGQYYRFQLSSVLSFGHRLTGLALAVGTLFLAAWLMALASGAEAYGQFVGYARSPLGLFLLLGWSWSLLYHLCNGLRHLVWDFGYAFERSEVDAGGWIVVVVSLILTAAVWCTAYLF
jgi:succinate dehydrogenase / fumarate reductase cytochrome b subunit